MIDSKHIVLVPFGGGNASAITGAMEIFEFARCEIGENDGLAVTVLSQDGNSVTCGRYITVTPSGSINEVSSPDLIFLAGSPCDVDEVLNGNDEVMSWIKAQHEQGVAIAVVCPSQALLAATGMLDDKDVAMHWSLIDEVSSRWPNVRWNADRMVIEDQGIYSCCGAGAAIDLALFIIDKLCGKDVMLACSQWFLTDLPRVRDQVPPPIVSQATSADPAMKPVESWILGHFHEPIHFEALAQKFDMSWRTFYRRFQESFGETPKVYLQKLRVNAARRLLESDSGTIEQIATRVGYNDPAFFRTLFNRHVGMSPSQYRETFRYRALH
ncbi:MAG: helix-turn-helix domain-containing protein [Pseudomonadota bacterium]